MAPFNFFKSKLAGPLLALTFLFARQCHAGYQIQDDCTDVQRAFLESALQSANTLADSARRTVGTNQNPDATRVFGWLFGTADPMIRVQGEVIDSLKGIGLNSIPVQGDPQGGDVETADVRIFCTHDRLLEGKPRTDGSKRIFDPGENAKAGLYYLAPNTTVLIEIQLPTSVTKEFLRKKFDCATALAWTIVPDQENSDQPDTLQICPWFLDYAMKQSIQFQDQFQPGKTASLISKLALDKLATWALYTPIDLFQLFDKVMVHELAHTRRALHRVDVGGFSGYGWKNCRKLSTVRGDHQDLAYNNADSIALFASICGLLGSGGMVNEDGTFVHGPAAPAPADGGDGGDGQGDGGEATKRSAVLTGHVVKKRTPRFDASYLKGRPLF